MQKLLVSLALAATATFGLGTAIAQAGTLDDVKAKGFVQCGVNKGLPGFGNPDASGKYTGFDVDYCRAVAAAIFGDPEKVKYTPLDGTERFPALQSGEIDLLVRNTTWTMSRDTTLGFTFAGVNYYDGEGFMVRKSLGVKSVKELDGATICVQGGTDTVTGLADYFKKNNLKYTPLVIDQLADVNAAYDSGRCDALTTDRSGLAANRLQMKNPDEHVVLDEIISQEPLGPVVRNNDVQWFQIVKWVSNALLDAEYLGVDSKNVDDMKNSPDAAVDRLLGVGDNDFGKSIGLSKDWAYNVIKAVGNYGEIYDRNIGPNTPLGLQRGVNAQWNKGGIQYGMPIL
ncbi:MAG TPA: amino acid ABC transporter substrate-binding protein [Devosia sp.]|jgi:general L-amino acid transport system substrate-binding protein|nr:amino acid ABC transporter substrate-binding protein [Devosia sp.]